MNADLFLRLAVFYAQEKQLEAQRMRLIRAAQVTKKVPSVR